MKFKSFASLAGKTALEGARLGISAGVRNSELAVRDDNILGNVYGVDISPSYNSLFSRDGSPVVGSTTTGDNWYFNNDNLGNSVDFPSTEATRDYNKENDPIFKFLEDKDKRSFLNIDDSNIYKLSIPKWGYADFINERNIFIKQLTNGYEAPNLLYFKLFFNFKTDQGLFGNILINSPIKTVNASDTIYQVESLDKIIENNAQKYLYNNANLHTFDRLPERRMALIKFTKLLSYISVFSPWFFKSVNGLDSFNKMYTNDYSEERSFSIQCAPDAIDMRLTTLLSLYKFAVVDEINGREILPENLRKFDMCLLVFSVPVKGLHDPLKMDDEIKRKKYKDIYSFNNTGVDKNDNESKNNSKSKNTIDKREIDEKNGEEDTVLSYKLYKFVNCEIDINSISSVLPNEVSNEQGFQMGNNSITIKYDKVYEYNWNEIMGILIGTDGIYVNNEEIGVKHINNYSDLILGTEALIRDRIGNLLGNNVNYALGNIYGQESRLYNVSSNPKDTEYTINDITEYTQNKFMYYSNKFRKNHNSILALGYNWIYTKLGSGYTYGSLTTKYSNSGTILAGINGSHKPRVGGTWAAKLESYMNDPWNNKITSMVEQANTNVNNFDFMHYANQYMQQHTQPVVVK